jgi:hypothetical protein
MIFGAEDPDPVDTIFLWQDGQLSEIATVVDSSRRHCLKDVSHVPGGL